MAEVTMTSPRDLFDLRGRVALVTGGAGHLGGAICRALADCGAHVVAADLAAAFGNRPLPEEVDLLSVDLSDAIESRTVVEGVVERCGGVDILVHCAAFVGTSDLPGWSVPIEEQTVDAWDRAIRVNLTAAFLLAQAAREPMARCGHGSIIFVSSIYGITGPDPSLYAGTSMGNPAAYGASKAGLIQLTRHLATHFAPRIRVNALSPGGIERGQHPVFIDRYERRTPLGRMATEDDLVGPIVFLASDMSAYVTGHNLVVDGGWTIW